MPKIVRNGIEYGSSDGSGGSSSTDYTNLQNKPSVNSVTLSGNKTSSDLGLASTSDLANKVDGTGLSMTVDERGILNVSNASDTPSHYALPAGGTTGQVLKKASDDDDDVEWADDGYTLPTASENTLGGVKVGGGLSIDANGYLSSSNDGGHTILDDGTAMVQRGSLNFVDHDLDDDESNSETIVAPHLLTSEELDELAMPGVPTDMPVLLDERGTEYQVGWYVNSSGLKKPVYEKTVNCGALPNNNTKKVQHNISNVDHVWVYSGFSENTTSGFTNQLNLTNDTTSGQWYTGVNKTYIEIWAGSNRTSYNNTYVILRYTKTTDTPA